MQNLRNEGIVLKNGKFEGGWITNQWTIYVCKHII